MTKLPPALFSNLQQAWQKVASSIFDDAGGAFFPTNNSQDKWKYTRTPEALYLNNGGQQYAFKFPKELGEEETETERLSEINPAAFTDPLSQSGFAQVHRSDPGSAYITLQDGRSNPTFTIQHDAGKSWKVVPKRKIKRLAKAIVQQEALKDEVQKAVADELQVHPEALLKGACALFNDRLGFFDETRFLKGFEKGAEMYDTVAGAALAGVGHTAIASGLWDRFTKSPDEMKLMQLEHEASPRLHALASVALPASLGIISRAIKQDLFV